MDNCARPGKGARPGEDRCAGGEQGKGGREDWRTRGPRRLGLGVAPRGAGRGEPAGETAERPHRTSPEAFLARNWPGFLHAGGPHRPGRPFPPGRSTLGGSPRSLRRQLRVQRLARGRGDSPLPAGTASGRTPSRVRWSPAGPEPPPLARSGTGSSGRARGVGALDAGPPNLPAATRGRCGPRHRSAAGHCAGVRPGTSALSFRARPDRVQRRSGPPQAGSNRQGRVVAGGRPAPSRSGPA